jgi:2-keto-3-deoxy-6-phosphogluconate aldolase
MEEPNRHFRSLCSSLRARQVASGTLESYGDATAKIRLNALFDVSPALLKTLMNFLSTATIPIILGSAVHSSPFFILITTLPLLKWAQARAMTF